MKIFALALFTAAIGMSQAMAADNPASAYCERLGGKTVPAKLADGSEIGLCVFENGNAFEEWTLFRLFNGKND